MSADLFGNPLGKAPGMELNLQQKRQAALLSHWTSLDYLKGLKLLIDDLIAGVDVDLRLAQSQGRDKVIANARWGVRDTSANWSTHAFPALQDFRQSTIKLIGWRSRELYCGTGTNQCARMVDEFSRMWMTPDEHERFTKQSEAVFHYGRFIDYAVGVGGVRRLDNAEMIYFWPEFEPAFPRLPCFRVRTDVVGESGKRPPRTGVYVPQDDPNGTLQFAWTGSEEGALDEVSTLNELGLRILSAVGRDALWVDGAAMARAVGPMFDRGELTERNGFDVGDEHDPRWVVSVVAEDCFTKHPCKWYFVELIDGEFDDEATPAAVAQAPAEVGLRCPAGQPCPKRGWWSTPAKADSRRQFAVGEVLPELGSDYGATIWQWDADQA